MEKDIENKPNGSVAVIYRNSGEGRQYLLVNQFSGNISLVGGGSEAYDVSLDDTMIREIDEEIGLKPIHYSLEKTDYTYQVTFQGGHRVGQTAVRQVYVSQVPPEVEIKANLNEIAGVFWADEEECLAKVTIDPLKKIMEKLFTEIS